MTYHCKLVNPIIHWTRSPAMDWYKHDRQMWPLIHRIFCKFLNSNQTKLTMLFPLQKNITPKYSTPQNVYGLGRSEINEFSSAKFLEHSPSWKTPSRDVFASEQMIGGYMTTQPLSQSQHGAIKLLSKQINHLEQVRKSLFLLATSVYMLNLIISRIY